MLLESIQRCSETFSIHGAGIRADLMGKVAGQAIFPLSLQQAGVPCKVAACKGIQMTRPRPLATRAAFSLQHKRQRACKLLPSLHAVQAVRCTHVPKAHPSCMALDNHGQVRDAPLRRAELL